MFFVGPGGRGTVESAGCGVIRRHAVWLQPLPSLRPGRFGIFPPFQPSSQPRRLREAPSPTLMAPSILLFDRHGHPVVPTCEPPWPSRAVAVKDGRRPSRFARREASLTVASTAASWARRDVTATRVNQEENASSPISTRLSRLALNSINPSGRRYRPKPGLRCHGPQSDPQKSLIQTNNAI